MPSTWSDAGDTRGEGWDTGAVRMMTRGGGGATLTAALQVGLEGRAEAALMMTRGGGGATLIAADHAAALHTQSSVWLSHTYFPSSLSPPGASPRTSPAQTGGCSRRSCGTTRSASCTTASPWSPGACPTPPRATTAGAACSAAWTPPDTSPPRPPTRNPWARSGRCSTRPRTASSPSESAHGHR